MRHIVEETKSMIALEDLRILLWRSVHYSVKENLKLTIIRQRTNRLDTMPDKTTHCSTQAPETDLTKVLPLLAW